MTDDVRELVVRSGVPPHTLADLAVVSGLVLVVVAVAMVITALVARRLNRVSVVDVTWGLAFVAAAVVCALVGPSLTDADAWRAWLLVVLVAVWGGRLAWHILKRSRGHGEDPRYVKLLGGEMTTATSATPCARCSSSRGWPSGWCRCRCRPPP